MKTRVILVTALVLLLALPLAVHAQEGMDPVTVTEDFVGSVNEGDAAAAQVVMSEDATVTVPQATSGEEEEEEEADPAAQTQYTGSAETQAWLEAQAAAGAQINLGECSVEGETATCAASYTSSALTAMGVSSVEGTLMVTVVEGQIQSYDFTPSAESVAMLQSAMAPKALPETGGAKQGTTYVLVLAALGLLLAGGAFVGTRAFKRAA